MDDILALTQSLLARGCESFCSLHWFIFDCIFIPSLVSLNTLLSMTMLEYSGQVSVLATRQMSCDTEVGLIFVTEATLYASSGFVL